MYSPLFVCLSVCLSVSNFMQKTTERIFTKMLFYHRCSRRQGKTDYMLELVRFWMTKMPKVKNFHIVIAAV